MSLWLPGLLVSMRPSQENQDHLAIRLDHRGHQEADIDVNATNRSMPLNMKLKELASLSQTPPIPGTLDGDEAMGIPTDAYKLKPSKQRVKQMKEADVDDFESATSGVQVRKDFDCRDTCPSSGACVPAEEYENLDETHPYNIICGQQVGRVACEGTALPDYGACKWEPNVRDSLRCNYFLQAWLSPLLSFQNLVPTAAEVPVCCPCGVKAVTKKISDNDAEAEAFKGKKGGKLLETARRMRLTGGSNEGLAMGRALEKLQQFRDVGLLSSITAAEWQVLEAAKRQAIDSSPPVRERPYHEVLRQMFFQRFQRQSQPMAREDPEARRKFRDAVEDSWPEFTWLKSTEILRDVCPSVIPVEVSLKLLAEPPVGFPDELNRATYPQLLELVQRVSRVRSAKPPEGDGQLPEGGSGSYLAQMMTIKLRQAMTCAGLLDKDTAMLRTQEQVCKLVACNCRPRVSLWAPRGLDTQEKQMMSESMFNGPEDVSNSTADEWLKQTTVPAAPGECEKFTSVGACINHGRAGTGDDWPVFTTAKKPLTKEAGCGKVTWCGDTSAGCTQEQLDKYKDEYKEFGGICGYIIASTQKFVPVPRVQQEDCQHYKLKMYRGRCWLGRNSIQGKCTWGSDLQLAFMHSEDYKDEEWEKYDKSNVYGGHRRFGGLEFVEYTLPSEDENAIYWDSSTKTRKEWKKEHQELNDQYKGATVSQCLGAITSCLGGFVNELKEGHLDWPWGWLGGGSTAAFVEAGTRPIADAIPVYTGRHWGTLKFRYWKPIAPGSSGFEDGLGGGAEIWSNQHCPLLMRKDSKDNINFLSTANLAVLALMRQYVLEKQDLSKSSLHDAAKRNAAKSCARIRPDQDGRLTLEREGEDITEMIKPNTVVRAIEPMEFEFDNGEDDNFKVEEGSTGKVVHVSDFGARVSWECLNEDIKWLPKGSFKQIEILEGAGADPIPNNVASCVRTCLWQESNKVPSDRETCNAFFKFCRKEENNPQSPRVSAACSKWATWYKSQIFDGCENGDIVVDDDNDGNRQRDAERVFKACKRRRILDLKTAMLYNKHFTGNEDLDLSRTCKENTCDTSMAQPVEERPVENSEANRYRLTFPSASGTTPEARAKLANDTCKQESIQDSQCAKYSDYVEKGFECSSNDDSRIDCGAPKCIWLQGSRGNTKAHSEDPGVDARGAMVWMDNKKEKMRCISQMSPDHLAGLWGEAEHHSTSPPSCMWHGFTRCLQISWSSMLSPVCGILSGLYEKMFETGKVFVVNKRTQSLLSNGNAWRAPTFVSTAYLGSAAFAGAMVDISGNKFAVAKPARIAFGVAGGVMATLTVKALWTSDHYRRAGPTLWKAEVQDLSNLESLMDSALEPTGFLGCVHLAKRLKVWAYFGAPAPMLMKDEEGYQQHIGLADQHDGMLPYSRVREATEAEGTGYRIAGGWVVDDDGAVKEVDVRNKQCAEAIKEYESFSD